MAQAFSSSAGIASTNHTAAGLIEIVAGRGVAFKPRLFAYVV